VKFEQFSQCVTVREKQINGTFAKNAKDPLYQPQVSRSVRKT